MEPIDFDEYIQITEHSFHEDVITGEPVLEFSVMDKVILYIPLAAVLAYALGRLLSGGGNSESLILDIITKCNAKICKLLIYDTKQEDDNMEYLSKILIENNNGEEYFIEIKLIQGYLIAEETKCAIYVAKKLIPLAAEMWYDAQAPDLCERLRNIDPNTLVNYSVDKLLVFLNKTVEEEEFELSSIIQTILDAKRNSE